MRATGAAIRVRPDTTYTGVNAWELRALLDAEPPGPASPAPPAEPGTVALIRPYARAIVVGAACG